nr:MAG TPA: hypothetical protein [Caudoviricetes sp.]
MIFLDKRYYSQWNTWYHFDKFLELSRLYVGLFILQKKLKFLYQKLLTIYSICTII